MNLIGLRGTIFIAVGDVPLSCARHSFGGLLKSVAKATLALAPLKKFWVESLILMELVWL